jgi:A/G-specific adenine glycosylase
MAADGRVRLQAAALLTPARPGDVTAALMDLGQLVCTPRNPDCGACPLAAECAALSHGAVARFPRRKPRPQTQRVFVPPPPRLRERALLVARRSRDAGPWLFPSARRLARAPSRACASWRAASACASARADRPDAPRSSAATWRRRVSATRTARRRAPSAAVRCSPAQLGAAAIPTLTRRIAAAGLLRVSAR